MPAQPMHNKTAANRILKNFAGRLTAMGQELNAASWWIGSVGLRATCCDGAGNFLAQVDHVKRLADKIESAETPLPSPPVVES